MKKYKWFLYAPLIVAAVAGIVALLLLVIKSCWAWIVPDLFPGAVTMGMVAKELSWYTSFKLAVVLFIVGAIFTGKSACSCRCKKEDISE